MRIDVGSFLLSLDASCPSHKTIICPATAPGDVVGKFCDGLAAHWNQHGLGTPAFGTRDFPLAYRLSSFSSAAICFFGPTAIEPSELTNYD